MERENQEKAESAVAVEVADDEIRTNATNKKDNGDGGGGEEEEPLTVEQIFWKKEKVLPWRQQLTARAFAVSFVLSIMFSFIVMKLNLTTGIIPSLNVAAGLLGYFFVKIFTKLLEKSNLLTQPFTRQENTVIQTCVVAASGIAYSGGFGSYLFAMSETIVHQSDPTSTDFKNPKLGWMIGFLFVVSFLGLFSLVPLRKMMIVDFKLTYPSGTATAHLINSFHTPQGAKLAKKQVRELGKFFSLSFLWSFFQWFYTSADDCGFQKFPTFGLQALQHRFYFNFSATYVGVGMICPHIVNVSLLIGGILSWGIMWPLIETRKGHWYSADLDPSDIQALKGYQVFIAIALILGDGLYNFAKVLAQTIAGMIAIFKQRRNSRLVTAVAADAASPIKDPRSFDEERRTSVFLKDQIPTSFAVGGYAVIAAVSTATLPHIFSHLRWFHIVVIYAAAPVLAFCNAFGAGLTDWSLASAYGKLAIFTVGAWAGASHGGALAGLAACGVMMNIVSTASDLMQDFKTGYMTLASPRAMFAAQAAGTAMGCVIAPCVFWVFYEAFPLGDGGGEYPAPFASIYYEMAKLGVEGFSKLPHNCLNLCYGFFAAAAAINLVRDAVGKERSWWIPLPMAMAIPFYLGSYFAIDMCVGGLILYVWQRRDRAGADALAPAVASGLICGDGMWAVPNSILALVGVEPPICMKFLSKGDNKRVAAFLGS